MRAHTLTALLLTLPACGLLPANPEIDPKAAVFYAQFLSDANRFHRVLDLGDLVISFDNFSDQTLEGYCTSPKKVVLSNHYWAHLNRLEREELIYHELGHCVLDQEHRPNSIMAEYGLMPWDYQVHHDAYVEELFTHNGS